MHSKRGLILIGLAVFAVGLIVTLPARVAYRWVAPPEILLSGIRGSVWSGEAQELSVGGIYLRDVTWESKPLQLFLARLAFHVTGNPTSGFLETDASFSLGGAVSFKSLRAAMPLNLVATVSGVRGLQGSATAQFERITLVDGLPIAADGTLQVADLKVPLVGRDSLGGYKADFFTQNNGVAASVEDTDAVVDLAGSLTIHEDRSYAFTGQVLAKPNTPAGIQQQLKFLGSPNERGQYELRLEGTF